MAGSYEEYLALLSDLSRQFAQLSDLAQEKTQAVRKDDLLALDEVLKREQALALALRGQEQRRLAMVQSLNLEDVPLAQLAKNYPPELQLQAKDAVEDLSRQYQIYRSAAEVARNTLECNLHEIEKTLAQIGGNQASAGPGYQAAAETAPPPRMKTDFRA